MTVTQREIELKLELARPAMQRLRTEPAPDGFTVGRAATRTLRSIYFDNADRALRKAKWSLRVRKVGRAWIQTVKAGTGVKGGMSKPREEEVPVAGPAPDLTRIADPGLREGLWRLVAGLPLEPVFETMMKRTTRIFETVDGSVIEMALDAGEIRAGERIAPLFEAELELKQGRPADLFRLAGALSGTAVARFSTLTKAGRGYALANGETPEIKARTAADVDLDPATDTAETAFRAILVSCMDQIAANRDVTLDSNAPEGPHQLRVGLRRLRSALKVHHALLESEVRAGLDAAARDLANRVGDLRDLDVLAEEIVAPAAGFAPQALAADRLAELVLSGREKARAALRAALLDPSVNALLFRIGALAEGDGRKLPETGNEAADGGRPLAEFAAEALDKRWKAAARLAARIEDLTLEERHDLRKELKKLRYTVEFFRPAFAARKVKPFLSRLKTLQDVFGYLNDVVMAGRLADIATSGQRKQPAATLLAAGFVMGWHEARAEHAWESARALWDETRRVRKFWRDR
ncbi:CYTH and CHAD domain-containing protein [Stappia sp. MMSF_3263]|uniref:CYTH and CHAD domain-containing protein n=1 Tax=Stappia sp. MMSF_3263 TaxID=3046693 RepID=UPI00273D63FB|nr:CYTH and CHAD domain-containing protein [Stappia sp. MMSF_3263]